METALKSTGPALSHQDVVCFKGLAVISQMTLVTAQAPVASASPLPAATSFQQATAHAGAASTENTVMHTTAQLAMGHPYSLPPPPTGYLYLPVSYWGACPYPYQPYTPPPPPPTPSGETQPGTSLVPPPPHGFQPASMVVDPSVFTMAKAMPAQAESLLPPPLMDPARPSAESASSAEECHMCRDSHPPTERETIEAWSHQGRAEGTIVVKLPPGSNYLLFTPPHAPNIYEENRGEGANPVNNSGI